MTEHPPVERPILFSGPMVRAVLDGSKTQTRRVVLPQPRSPHYLQPMWGTSPGPDPVNFGTPYLWREVGPDYPDGDDDDRRCPYGRPGDRLWVRETHAILDMRSDVTDFAVAREPRGEWPASVTYAADDATVWCPNVDARDWRIGFDNDHVINRPSIHMPRWASRLTLEVTGVRVERVQDISEADATAEGMTAEVLASLGFSEWASAASAYPYLWDSINKKRGYGWDTNPWVWVLTFHRIEATA